MITVDVDALRFADADADSLIGFQMTSLLAVEQIKRTTYLTLHHADHERAHPNVAITPRSLRGSCARHEPPPPGQSRGPH